MKTTIEELLLEFDRVFYCWLDKAKVLLALETAAPKAKSPLQVLAEANGCRFMTPTEREDLIRRAREGGPGSIREGRSPSGGSPQDPAPGPSIGSWDCSDQPSAPRTAGTCSSPSHVHRTDPAVREGRSLDSFLSGKSISGTLRPGQRIDIGPVSLFCPAPGVLQVRLRGELVAGIFPGNSSDLRFSAPIGDPLPLCRLGPGGDFVQDYTPGVSPDDGVLPDHATGASGTTVAAGSGPASPASRQDGASLTVGGPGSGFAKAR